ncbi:MAG: hypothetical protein EAX96_02720 [Candidatus Lokiarchaeota archaeon]|nr:hypothetical protein [Candidatus Lokiarchaeota archaeon]
MIAFDISHNQADRLGEIFEEITFKTGDQFQFIKHEDFPIELEGIKKYSIFIILQPDRTQFNVDEPKAIFNYVESGGNLLLLGNAGGDHAHFTNFSEKILTKFGVKFNEDRIIDHEKPADQNESIFTIKDLTHHPIFSDVQPEYSNGCSLIIGDSRAKILASKNNAPLIAEIHYGLGNVVIIGSYLMFKISKNASFFMNIMNYFSGTIKIEEIKAPKFQFTIPSKLSGKSIELDNKTALDKIQISDQAFNSLIQRLNMLIKKFTLHKDLNRIKRIKNYSLRVEQSLKNLLIISDEKNVDNDKVQLRNSYENLFREFLEMELIYEEKELIKEFQQLFDELGKMLKKRFNMLLTEQISSKSKTELEIDKLKKQVRGLEYQKNELISNRKYLGEQIKNNLISNTEFQSKMEHLKQKENEFDEEINYLKGRIKLLSSI